jgi:hypothetical protein
MLLRGCREFTATGNQPGTSFKETLMPVLFTNVHTLPSTDVSSAGMPFSFQPPTPGCALVGLVVRAGHWIDQITPLFAELLEDGTIGPQMRGPSYGGHGGTVQELQLSPGHVVTGIQTRSGDYVDAVRLLQAKWDGSTIEMTTAKWTQWIGAPNMGGVERIERLVEPVGGAVAIGIAGRAGRYVDNLTLIGAEPVRVAGTAVARGNARTGRNSGATASG